MAKYALLYNFYVATDKRNVCPVGWKVPTKEELEALSYALIAKREILPPDGFRYSTGSGYNSFSTYGSLWSSTLYDSENAWEINLSATDRPVKMAGSNTGLGIRCIKDADTKQASAPNTVNSSASAVRTPYTDKPLSIIFPAKPEVKEDFDTYYTKKFALCTKDNRGYIVEKVTYSKRTVDALRGTSAGYSLAEDRRNSKAKTINGSVSGVQQFTYKYKYGCIAYYLTSSTVKGRVKEILVNESTLYIVTVLCGADENVDTHFDAFFNTITMD